MRTLPTAFESDPQSEQQQRAAMMRRLGIVDETPPEPHLKVVPQVEAPAADELQLEDMLSRFGIEERPRAEAPPPRQPEPLTARVAEFDIPAQPIRAPEPEPEPQAPAPRLRAPEIADPEPEAPRTKPTQDEMLEEMRRELKGSRKSAKARGATAPISLSTPTKAQKRRKMGEMAYTRLVIWLLAIAASGLLTYNIVKASVEHDRALGRPSFVETFRGT